MSDGIYFVDANIPMYAVGAEHPLRQPSLNILEAIARGELMAVTDVEVLQEILHRYTALGLRDRAIEVARLFLRVIPEVLPVTRADFSMALRLHAEHRRIQARDSLHLAVMQRNGISQIITADRHFEGRVGIARLDPSDWPF